MRAERLQQQRALADAGLAAEEGDRARDQAAAEHTVELTPPVGVGGARRRVDLCDRNRNVRRDGDDRGRCASASVPHASHSGQRPNHRGVSHPHAAHRWTVFVRIAGTYAGGVTPIRFCWRHRP